MALRIEYIGAEWCKSCKTIYPKVESLGNKFSITLVSKDLDVDLNEAEKETITKLPTIRIYKDSNQVQEYFVNQVESLTNWLQENVKIKVAESDF